MSRIKTLLIAAILIFVVLSLGFYFSGKNDKQVKYRTEKADRGDVISAVTATGTLAPVTAVKVGSQVSGIIAKLYVDFNSKVTKGQLLAELDPTPLQAQVDQRNADYQKASVEERNANVAFQRSKKLLDNQLIAKSDYDVAEANLLSAKAQTKQAEAALRQAQVNLSYTKVVSPIDGVVIDRQYDIGQTVAASFQAPTLFTIAQDLTRMQVSTSIDEADIGSIQSGEEATFTVDAFPDRTFHGTVSQVRLSSQVVQNVVTYPVLIDVTNPNLALKPGMTANVSVPVKKETDVLRIPNAALRFKPEPSEVSSGQTGSNTGTGGSGYRRASEGRGNGNWSGKWSGQKGGGARKGTVVYVLGEKDQLKPISVRTSITDGTYTAIVGGDLKEGQPVVTGLATSRGMESTGGLNAPRQRRGPGF